MKRSITIILTVLAVFCLISESLAARYREPNLSRRDKTRTKRSRRGIKDANSLIKDFPFLKDPNAISAKVNEFEGLQASIDDVCKKNRRVFGRWTRVPIDDPAGLATEVQKQIIAEMVMIREIAAEEGAVKTTAAIDFLLLDRQDRLDKIIKRVSLKLRDQRGNEPETGNTRNGYRDSRGRRDRYRSTTGYRGRDSYRGSRDRGRYEERDRYSERPKRSNREKPDKEETTESDNTEQ